MQKIHVARNNAVTGIFTEDEVRTGLQNGTLLLTDLAWATGMPAWKALGQWSEFAAAENAGGAGGDTAQSPLVPQTPPPPPAPAEPVWERASRGGYWKAYWETVRDVLLNPTRTFGAMEKTASFGRAYVFVLIGGFISTVISLVSQLLFGNALTLALLKMFPFTEEQFQQIEQTLAKQQMGGLGVPEGADERTYGMIIGAQILGFVMGLAMVAAMPFITAGISHLFLMLFGGAKRGYDATFRVLSYTTGTTMLLSWVPLLGTLAGFYKIALDIIGLSEVHGISRGRAAAAVLAPILICICCFSVLAIWAFFIIANAKNSGAFPH